MQQLTDLHLDVLKEIGNIGAGNALKALSELIHKEFDMTVPEVMQVEFKDIAVSIGGAENTVVGIIANMSGYIEGMMMFILKLEDAKLLLRLLLESDIKELDEFTEYEYSALKEIGNILISSYLNSLSTLMKKTVVPSVPFLALDMANAILSVPAIHFGKIADNVLLIESVFSSNEYNVSGFFILAPELDSYDLIMEALGVH
jgi:chemotaxis protein CheC